LRPNSAASGSRRSTLSDLLEDLLSGIHACRLIFEEHAELPDSEEEWDEADADAWQAEQQDTFVDLVRAAATAKHGRPL
jgi:hypothetical protein